MKISKIIVVAFLFTGITVMNAQSVSKSLGLYVFPSKEQDAKTQAADEQACFKWAIEQTGYDPNNPPKVEAAQVNGGPNGAAVVGAAKGAAAGAAIGAIAGDAGDGAAIGAIVGGLRGRRARKAGAAQQQQQNNDAAQAKIAQMKAEYNKAFSACMEGKGYTVK